jgi:hypothetical protein
MPRQEPLNLLDLPIDILALILRPLLVLPQRQAVLICPCTHPPPLSVSLLTILLIHPAIHAIACPLFYEGNTFALDLTGPHTNHVRRVLQEYEPLKAERELAPEWLTDAMRLPLLASLGAMRRIASLELRIDKFRGWIVTDAIPLLEDMVVRGALTSLCVSVHSVRDSRGRHAHEHRKDKNTAIPTDSILSARPILALLADPYLATSRLRVEATHGPAWCRFHPGRDCRRTAASTISSVVEEQSADSVALPGLGPHIGSWSLMDIDWALVIRDIDPEGRELVPAWSEARGVGRHNMLPT